MKVDEEALLPATVIYLVGVIALVSISSFDSLILLCCIYLFVIWRKK